MRRASPLPAAAEATGVIFGHLTWGGRLALVSYAIRRVFVDPAPMDQRCVMGSTVDPSVHCPRHAIDLWCRRHDPE